MYLEKLKEKITKLKAAKEALLESSFSSSQAAEAAANQQAIAKLDNEIQRLNDSVRRFNKQYRISVLNMLISKVFSATDAIKSAPENFRRFILDEMNSLQDDTVNQVVEDTEKVEDAKKAEDAKKVGSAEKNEDTEKKEEISCALIIGALKSFLEPLLVLGEGYVELYNSIDDIAKKAGLIPGATMAFVKVRSKLDVSLNRISTKNLFLQHRYEQFNLIAQAKSDYLEGIENLKDECDQQENSVGLDSSLIDLSSSNNEIEQAKHQILCAVYPALMATKETAVSSFSVDFFDEDTVVEKTLLEKIESFISLLYAIPKRIGSAVIESELLGKISDITGKGWLEYISGEPSEYSTVKKLLKVFESEKKDETTLDDIQRRITRLRSFPRFTNNNSVFILNMIENLFYESVYGSEFELTPEQKKFIDLLGRRKKMLEAYAKEISRAYDLKECADLKQVVDLLNVSRMLPGGENAAWCAVDSEKLPEALPKLRERVYWILEKNLHRTDNQLQNPFVLKYNEEGEIEIEIRVADDAYQSFFSHSMSQISDHRAFYYTTLLIFGVMASVKRESTEYVRCLLNTICTQGGYRAWVDNNKVNFGLFRLDWLLCYIPFEIVMPQESVVAKIFEDFSLIFPSLSPASNSDSSSEETVRYSFSSFSSFSSSVSKSFSHFSGGNAERSASVAVDKKAQTELGSAEKARLERAKYIAGTVNGFQDESYKTVNDVASRVKKEDFHAEADIHVLEAIILLKWFSSTPKGEQAQIDTTSIRHNLIELAKEPYGGEPDDQDANEKDYLTEIVNILNREPALNSSKLNVRERLFETLRQLIKKISLRTSSISASTPVKNALVSTPSLKLPGSNGNGRSNSVAAPNGTPIAHKPPANGRNRAASVSGVLGSDLSAKPSSAVTSPVVFKQDSFFSRLGSFSGSNKKVLYKQRIEYMAKTVCDHVATIYGNSNNEANFKEKVKDWLMSFKGLNDLKDFFENTELQNTYILYCVVTESYTNRYLKEDNGDLPHIIEIKKIQEELSRCARYKTVATLNEFKWPEKITNNRLKKLKEIVDSYVSSPVRKISFNNGI